MWCSVVRTARRAEDLLSASWRRSSLCSANILSLQPSTPDGPELQDKSPPPPHHVGPALAPPPCSAPPARAFKDDDDERGRHPVQRRRIVITTILIEPWDVSTEAERVGAADPEEW